MSTLTDRAPTAPEAKPRLKRSIGLWMATALVVGNMVGSGIFTLPAVLSGEAGPASIVALAFTGVGAMLLALVFANLGRAYPKTGGPYHYARRAFGDFVGFQTAWAYWIAAWVGNAAIAVAFAGYLGVFWGDVNTKHWVAALAAVAAVWFFTLVNIVGARETGWAQVVTTVLKFVPLAVIGIVGLFYIKSGNFTPFTPVKGGFDWHINAAATLALWAFIGLESATVPAEEVKDPERTIPRATMLGTDRHDDPLHRRARRDRRRALAVGAQRLVGTVRRCRQRNVGGDLPRNGVGEVDRAGCDGRHAGSAQRLDLADRTRLARRGRRRSLPERRSHAFTGSVERRSSGSSSRRCSCRRSCSTTGTRASASDSRTSCCWRRG